MAKVCLICGKSMGAFSGKIMVADGYVCNDCWGKAGMGTSLNDIVSGNQYNSTILKEMIAHREQNQVLINEFKPTSKVGQLSLDDNTQTFVITKSAKQQELYHYNQVVDYQLLEDGETITNGGLGSAVAGGLLFGGAGAIVGSVTGSKKTKGVCKSLKIKITLRNSPKQTEYIDFITTETKTSGFIYKTAYKNAQDVLSALQLIVDSANNAASEESNRGYVSAADEILKYKNLLDAGIITEEEFNAKKTQLLNL